MWIRAEFIINMYTVSDRSFWSWFGADLDRKYGVQNFGAELELNWNWIGAELELNWSWIGAELELYQLNAYLNIYFPNRKTFHSSTTCLFVITMCINSIYVGQILFSKHNIASTRSIWPEGKSLSLPKRIMKLLHKLARHHHQFWRLPLAKCLFWFLSLIDCLDLFKEYYVFQSKISYEKFILILRHILAHSNTPGTWSQSLLDPTQYRVYMDCWNVRGW